MIFTSLDFLLFFPVVVLVYFAVPFKVRWAWLLAASYHFYMCWSVRYAFLMALSTIITFLSGILIQHANGITDAQKSRSRKRLWVAICLVLNLGILFVFKYFYFALATLNALLNPIGITIADPGFTIMLPVGISFYTFQALSYTMDVYNGEVQAEKHLGKYALFVSFFPQLVAGPIERSKNLLSQLYQKHSFDFQRVKSGLLLMLWGFFQKLVLADRIAIFVNEAYNNSGSQPGVILLIATVLFAIQIYCDFGGYSNIAIGAAQVMGFTLMVNFRRPYFARSVQEFWRRWHISLSTWFGDYLFAPLVWSRWTSRLPIVGRYVRKPPKYSALMITFLISGLWHGANWTFVCWGGLHGLLQIIGDITQKGRRRIYGRLNVRQDVFSFRLGQTICTFALICFSYIFFRAQSVGEAFAVVGRIATQLRPWALFDGTLYALGLDQTDFTLMLFAIGILLSASLMQRKICIRSVLLKQNLLFRWLFIICSVLVVVVLGVYGPEYDAAPFIYFQF